MISKERQAQSEGQRERERRGWQPLSTPNSTGPPTHYIPGVIITIPPPPPRCLNTTHPAHHLPLQPPSPPSTPFHAPPSPYQPRARLQHSHPCIHLFPITATLISPPPPSTRHDQTRPASHTVPPKRCRRRYPAIQPHRPILSPKPCVHVSQAPQKEWPPSPSRPKKPCPNGILTVPNAQSQLQYIDAMHNPPPAPRNNH